MGITENLKRASKQRDELIATDLLVTAKSVVRAYAVAVTETATPEVRKVLVKQLNQAIEDHAEIAEYMIKHDMYMAYDIEKQLKHDKEKVEKAEQLIKD
ncbi:MULTISPECIES: spore coat protein [Exiguobacterium]|uniref:spore coat protein n=1 Tax=Exiguobacterium TaxID=33986 RepID=UPI001BEC16B3|nr:MULTISPECIES: spore coat protein [Exiguobacterium]MCT4781615.1 spore coat protein [Exiguobacterium himgiriensis]